MKIASQKDFFVYVERRVLHAYADEFGYLTIGIGRLIDAKKGGGISDAECDYLFNNDIAKYTTELNAKFPWFGKLDPVRETVVLSMTFQVGSLSTWPHFCAAMAAGDYEAAAKAMEDSEVAKVQTPGRWKIQAQMMRDGKWPDIEIEADTAATVSDKPSCSNGGTKMDQQSSTAQPAVAAPAPVPAAPQGQALVNSHTFWGSVFTALAGSGVINNLIPVAAVMLTAAHVPDAPGVIQAVCTLAGVAWTLYGRMTATKPITGVLKAK